MGSTLNCSLRNSLKHIITLLITVLRFFLTVVHFWRARYVLLQLNMSRISVLLYVNIYLRCAGQVLNDHVVNHSQIQPTWNYKPPCIKLSDKIFISSLWVLLHTIARGYEILPSFLVLCLFNFLKHYFLKIHRSLSMMMFVQTLKYCHLGLEFLISSFLHSLRPFSPHRRSGS